MKILLDENFPLPLYHRLRSAGHDVEHIIVLGKRGVKDAELRKRIEEEDLALEGFMARRPSQKLFELLETGEIVPWEVQDSR